MWHTFITVKSIKINVCFTCISTFHIFIKDMNISTTHHKDTAEKKIGSGDWFFMSSQLKYGIEGQTWHGFIARWFSERRLSHTAEDVICTTCVRTGPLLEKVSSLDTLHKKCVKYKSGKGQHSPLSMKKAVT